jgi:hypothetical protein
MKRLLPWQPADPHQCSRDDACGKPDAAIGGRPAS